MGLNTFSENEVLELKKTTGELEAGVISIASILNKHQHGKLYFGIKDDGTVLGQQIGASTIRDVTSAISSHIEPKIYPNVSNIKIEDKDCILVEFEGDDVPYLAYGRAYMRIGDEDRQMTVKEMRKLLYKTETDSEKWESRISDKTLEDINEETLKDYVQRGYKAKRIPFQYTNKQEVLNKLGLIKEDNLLNACKVLFCDESNIELQVAIFATDTKTTFIDIDKYTGNVFELIKNGEEYIRKNIIWKVEITNKREEYPEIPLRAIREAIVNSFAHRNYLDPKGTEIAIFKNRVEIYNPGEFPEGYVPKDFIEGKVHSIFRNPLIAQTMYKSKDTEQYSSGLKRIYDECEKEGTKLGFRLEKYGFTVIFYRKDFSENKDLNMQSVALNEKHAQDNAQEKQKHAQDNAQEKPKQTLKVSEKELLDFCEEPKRLKEIIEYFGYRSVRGFREKYINPLLKENKLKQTIPEKPNSRNQRYIKVVPKKCNQR